jgi:hypothetical protein
MILHSKHASTPSGFTMNIVYIEIYHKILSSGTSHAPAREI